MSKRQTHNLTREDIENIEEEVKDAFYTIGELGGIYAIDVVLPSVNGAPSRHLMITNIHTALHGHPQYQAVLAEFREKLSMLLDSRVIETLRIGEQAATGDSGNKSS